MNSDHDCFFFPVKDENINFWLNCPFKDNDTVEKDKNRMTLCLLLRICL